MGAYILDNFIGLEGPNNPYSVKPGKRYYFIVIWGKCQYLHNPQIIIFRKKY
jgi:hypothetical protein